MVRPVRAPPAGRRSSHGDNVEDEDDVSEEKEDKVVVVAAVLAERESEVGESSNCRAPVHTC